MPDYVAEMENKSKLPKPSALRPPQVIRPLIDKGPSVPSTSKLQTVNRQIPSSLKLKRRSKSISDLRSLSTHFKSKTLELKKIQEYPVLPKVKEIVKKPLRPLNTPSSGIVHRNAPKRPGPKTEDDIKPKIAKQQKIPDWDYKSRFNVLNEKNKALLERYDAMKTKLADLEDIDSRYTQLESDKEIADLKIVDLTKENKSLKEGNSTLKKENLQLAENFEITSKQLGDLQVLYEVLKTKDENNERRIESLKQTKIKYEDLVSEHSSLVNNCSAITIDNEHLTRENSTLTEQLNTKNIECFSLEKENADMKQTIVDLEISRRSLNNIIQDLKGNIRVFCRIRPPVQGEDDYLQCSLNYMDESSLEIRKSKESISAVTSKPLESKAEFSFDHVFQPNSTQTEIFEELSLLVQSALDGYNICVFAYGQTGSGKTYTMQGMDTPEELGLIPRAIDLIFDSIKKLKKSDWVYEVRASFLEIYNENVHDLLNPNSFQNLDICYNEGKGTTVNNLIIKQTESAEELKKLMNSALENRQVAATNFNERSSRSHAVSKIYLVGSNMSTKQLYTASINLVDLAGSESAKYSIDERLVETKHINKSLSALGNVMLALHNKKKHIPYRDSKLTYLLQSSLGGNSKTLMIVNVSPFEQNYVESISTLRFASKVKEVRTNSKRNKTNLSPSR